MDNYDVKPGRWRSEINTEGGPANHGWQESGMIQVP